MAVITCPICNHHPLYEGAESCPKCGCPRSVWSAASAVSAGGAGASFAAAEPKVADGFEGSQAGERRELANGIAFRWCPAGRFRMGEDSNTVDVEISKGFWLAETQVTQGQFSAVMGLTPWKGRKDVKEGENYPATCVDHDECLGFCEKLTILEQDASRLLASWKYSLPTEAQWEYACRAGTTTKFSYGNSESLLVDYGWFNNNVGSEQYAREVGLKKPNPWGLYDMHGNVREFCRDGDGSKLAGGKDPLGPLSGPNRGNRGGSWEDAAASCRSGNRAWYLPSIKYRTLGFRVAVVPD